MLEFKAQHYTHDFGVFAGSVGLETDYGQKENFESYWSNSTSSISIAHYLSFYNRTLRWNPDNAFRNHLMVKTEVEYINNSKLKHYGIYTENSSSSSKKLEGMKGTLTMVQLGVSLECFLIPLEEFIHPHSPIWFNPFFTFGLKYSHYTNGLKSDLGDWKEDITVLPQKYTLENALDIGAGEAFSLSAGLGTRFKLAQKIDLVTQFSSQFFFSDAIDGLQSPAPENKSNEWLLNIQFGIVYHLNYNEPLFY